MEGKSRPDADQALALLDGLLRMKEVDTARRQSKEEFEEQSRLRPFSLQPFRWTFWGNSTSSASVFN